MPSQLLGVVCQDAHFVALLVSIHDKTVSVVDGLNTTIETWKVAANYLLRKFGLIAIDRMDLHPFSLKRGTYMVQKDGYNCGPIVCSYVWNILSNGVFDGVNYSGKETRIMIVEKYKALVDECSLHLMMKNRVARKEKKVGSTRVVELHPATPDIKEEKSREKIDSHTTPRTKEVRKLLDVLSKTKQVDVVEKRKAERLCSEERSRKRQAIQGQKMVETFAKNHQLHHKNFRRKNSH
jgi:hypothetical protein